MTFTPSTVIHMQRNSEDRRILIEAFLGTVAVMYIPIKDRHPLDSTCLQRSGSDGYIVEKAVTISPSGHRMMARRPNQGHRRSTTAQYTLPRGDAGASGRQKAE
nr:hypothetical protein FFPRI1PSEUD_23620 [Pseudomonas sp. FFPRI_1]